jgi:hypothetical protein
MRYLFQNTVFDHSYFHSNGKFLAIQLLRIFEMFSAFICSSVFSQLELLVGLGVLRNLIDSSAHRSEREIIVTQGKFQFDEKEILIETSQNVIKEKKQIFLILFILYLFPII